MSQSSLSNEAFQIVYSDAESVGIKMSQSSLSNEAFQMGKEIAMTNTEIYKSQSSLSNEAFQI